MPPTEPSGLPSLCPAQKQTYDFFRRATPLANLFVLWTPEGRGRTTVLRHLHRDLGGGFVSIGDYMGVLRHFHPAAMEEAFEKLMLEALAAHDTVFLDDYHLLADVVTGCGNHFYQRRDLIAGPWMTIAAAAVVGKKRLYVGTDASACRPLGDRAYAYSIDRFGPDDYRHIARAHLGKAAARIDFDQVHRFAPKLDALQLVNSCVWLRADKPDTERFIEYLRSQQMASNVDLGEVEAVELHDLKGIDDLLKALEAGIIVPLEHDALSKELGIKPKRGVLLAGPPGTGKTTVGRALAHRLKSKFFLIDGTVISGTSDFYARVHRVFEAAKSNAPSIVFIDDSDVIFENSEQTGLYRYLLTMLDGLESETAGRVCVMMTAMDVGNLPPALVRSGRIELWLETRLPDIEARHSILERHLGGLPAAMGPVDVPAIAEAADGLTGADLKRLVEDGKILYAYDRANGHATRPATEYFLSAIETVCASKAKYAEAEAKARERHPSRPSFFDMFSGMGGPPPGMDSDE